MLMLMLMELMIWLEGKKVRSSKE